MSTKTPENQFKKGETSPGDGFLDTEAEVSIAQEFTEVGRSDLKQSNWPDDDLGLSPEKNESLEYDVDDVDSGSGFGRNKSPRGPKYGSIERNNSLVRPVPPTFNLTNKMSHLTRNSQ